MDLVKILKNAPKGTKLWSPAYGDVELMGVNYYVTYPIGIKVKSIGKVLLSKEGKFFIDDNVECILFPSKDQRNWSKFVMTPNKVKVVLHPFDRVLVRVNFDDRWSAAILESVDDNEQERKYTDICGYNWENCIPYTCDTAGLLFTTDPCPIDYEIEFSKEFVEK